MIAVSEPVPPDVSVKHTCRSLFFWQAFSGVDNSSCVRFAKPAALRPNNSGQHFVLRGARQFAAFLHALHCQRYARVAKDHDREVRGQTTKAGENEILARGGRG